MKPVLEFLAELRENNNRDWFTEHKLLYKEIQKDINALTEELIMHIGEFDPDIRPLTVADCTYRIYRDVRFSKNKDPYKTHIGIYLCRGGKKSNYAGYYIHIEPETEARDNFTMGGSALVMGSYMPEPKVLRSIREEILDNGNRIMEALEKAKGFELNTDSVLKRTPVGFPAGHRYDNLLRLKDFNVIQSVSVDFLTQPYLARAIAGELAKTHDLCVILNRAIQYANEEM